MVSLVIVSTGTVSLYTFRDGYDVRLLNETVGDLKRRLEILNDSVAQEMTNSEQLLEQVAANITHNTTRMLTRGITRLEDTMDNRLTGVGQRLSLVNESLVNKCQKVQNTFTEQLHEQENKTVATFQQLDENYRNLSESIESNTRKVSELSNNFQRKMESVPPETSQNLSKELSAMNFTVGTLARTISKMQLNVTACSERISLLNSTTLQLSDTVGLFTYYGEQVAGKINATNSLFGYISNRFIQGHE